MIYVALFFSGAFLCNCIPHLVAGLSGAPFPSPFAKPPGKGNSSPLVNFIWGAFNLAVGLGLHWLSPVTFGFNLEFGTLALGFLLSGLWLAYHFGKVRSGK